MAESQTRPQRWSPACGSLLDYEFRKQSTELKSNSDFSLDLPESDRSGLVNLSDSKSVLSFYFSGIDVDLKGGFSLTQAFPGNTEFSLDT